MTNNNEILHLITNIKKGSFVTVEKTSDAKLKKTGNPLNGRRVEKRSKFQIQVGCDSQRLENAQATKEGREARTIGDLPWGEYVADGVPVIKHKGELYLRGFWKSGIDTGFTVDGVEATAEQVEIIKQFSPKSKGFDKSAPLCIKFENIDRIAGGGKVVG